MRAAGCPRTALAMRALLLLRLLLAGAHWRTAHCGGSRGWYRVPGPTWREGTSVWRAVIQNASDVVCSGGARMHTTTMGGFNRLPGASGNTYTSGACRMALPAPESIMSVNLSYSYAAGYGCEVGCKGAAVMRLLGTDEDPAKLPGGHGILYISPPLNQASLSTPGCSRNRHKECFEQVDVFQVCAGKMQNCTGKFLTFHFDNHKYDVQLQLPITVTINVNPPCYPFGHGRGIRLECARARTSAACARLNQTCKWRPPKPFPTDPVRFDDRKDRDIAEELYTALEVLLVLCAICLLLMIVGKRKPPLRPAAGVSTDGGGGGEKRQRVARGADLSTGQSLLIPATAQPQPQPEGLHLAEAGLAGGVAPAGCGVGVVEGSSLARPEGILSQNIGELDSNIDSGFDSVWTGVADVGDLIDIDSDSVVLESSQIVDSWAHLFGGTATDAEGLYSSHSTGDSSGDEVMGEVTAWGTALLVDLVAPSGVGNGVIDLLGAPMAPSPRQQQQQQNNKQQQQQQKQQKQKKKQQRVSRSEQAAVLLQCPVVGCDYTTSQQRLFKAHQQRYASTEQRLFTPPSRSHSSHPVNTWNDLLTRNVGLL